MIVRSLRSADMKFPSKESCKRVCEAEPECQYYFHGLKEQSCEMYPESRKSCKAIIGRLDIDKCNSSEFKVYYCLHDAATSFENVMFI